MTLQPYQYAYINPVMFNDPTGMRGEPIDGAGPDFRTRCFDDMDDGGPGDPHKVQVYQYTIFQNKKGWFYTRNQQNDHTITRYENDKKNLWTGPEEYHFYNPINKKTYDNPGDFAKNFPSAKEVGESIGETLKRSGIYTKQVVKIAWNSPETQPILLAPFIEILAAGSLAESSNIGRITKFEKIAAYGTEEVRVGQGLKIIAKGGSEKAAYIFNNLIKNGYKATLKGDGEKAIYELTKGADKILFRKSQSGGYSKFDTFFKVLGDGKNLTVWFKN